MWVCSNCGNRQEGEPTRCEHCGFDGSADVSRYPTLIPKWAKQSPAYKPPQPEERPHRKRARSKYKRYFKAKDARKLCVDGRLPKAVILPDGIDVVVRDAFWGIPGTTADKIILPRGLKKVQEEAFGHLTVQDYIVIPDSVTEIGKNAFCLEKRHMSSAIRAAMLTGIASRTTCGIPLIWNINGRSRRKPNGRSRRNLCGKSAGTLVCAHIAGAVIPSFFPGASNVAGKDEIR